MRKLQIVGLLLIMMSAFLCSAPPLLGQAVTGSITGYITDPSGAAIPNAAVTATEMRTSVATTRSTDAVGLYLITNLVPGTYAISVGATGFKTFTLRGVQLEVGATARTDAKLELGELTQQITVEAHGAALETEKTDVSRVFSAHAVASLPIVGGNTSQLFTLVPGAVRDNFQMSEGENPQQSNRVSVNGAWSGAQTFTLDGISVVDFGYSGIQIVVPIQDSVQVMKVTTGDYDPEFGQTAGMVAQFITKSGTNQLHGSLFYRNRNSSTFAADPVTEKIAGTGPTGKGLGVSPSNFNQWGGSLGGPIKKNKVFLFGATQWNRLRQTSGLIATVPNAAFRAGDFSSMASTRPIYDPATGNPDGTGRTQFSYGGVPNVIPPDRIGTVAKNLLAILPMPNTGTGTDNNYVGSPRSVFNQWQVDTRGDINVSDKNKLFVTYNKFNAHLDNPPLFGLPAGGASAGSLTAEVADFAAEHAVLNWTHTFGATLIMEARGGFSHFVLDGLHADHMLQTNNKVGIPNINMGDSITGGLAALRVSGPVGAWFMGVTGTGAIPRFQRNTGIQGVNNWTWMHSNHQLRFGGEVVRERFGLASPNLSTRGRFDFAETITGAAGMPGSGLGMAAFLLGMPSGFGRGILKQIPGERQTRTAVYGQDIWRATPKLTLTLGLRWDYFTPVTPERPGGTANFDPDTGNILLGGLGSVPASIGIRTPKDDIAPRLGVAYRLTSKTVLRAGLGRSFFGTGYDAIFTGLTNVYPIVAQQQVAQSTLYQAVFPIEQGPPEGTLPLLPSSGILRAPDGYQLKYRPFDWLTETMDSWNFTIARELMHDTTLSVAYVGSKGTHLFRPVNFNSAPIGPGDLKSRRPFYVKYGLSQQIDLKCNCSDANYNALQIEVKKGYAKNLALTANFTWQKALGHATNHPYNAKVGYGVGGGAFGVVDRAATFTLGHTIVFPYGTGQRWGSGASGIMKAALGGWQFHGVTVIESGVAVSPTLSSNATLNSDIKQVPDRVPGCDPRDVSGGQNRWKWYDKACFTTPAMYTFGNAAVGSLRGPGVATADFALWKGFDLEKAEIELRIESFNVFNRTNLGIPGANTDSTSAGVITALQPGFPMRRFQFGLHMSW